MYSIVPYSTVGLRAKGRGCEPSLCLSCRQELWACIVCALAGRCVGKKRVQYISNDVVSCRCHAGVDFATLCFHAGVDFATLRFSCRLRFRHLNGMRLSSRLRFRSLNCLMPSSRCRFRNLVFSCRCRFRNLNVFMQVAISQP